MKVVVLCEGETEKAFGQILKEYLSRIYTSRAQNENRIGIDPKRVEFRRLDKLAREVQLHLAKQDTIGVVLLVDVYPDYSTPEQAKNALRAKISSDPRVYYHVAHHDFEAWLLPYWTKIKKRVGLEVQPFAPNPETVNDISPPSKRLIELFRRGNNGPKEYKKQIEATDILRGEDLEVAARACPELKELLNTILGLAELPLIQ